MLENNLIKVSCAVHSLLYSFRQLLSVLITYSNLFILHIGLPPRGYGKLRLVTTNCTDNISRRYFIHYTFTNFIENSKNHIF